MRENKVKVFERLSADVARKIDKEVEKSVLTRGKWMDQHFKKHFKIPPFDNLSKKDIRKNLIEAKEILEKLDL